MDPQQRLLLEVGYTSLHDTGQRKTMLCSTDMGIFLGIMNTDFSAMPKESTGVYEATGGTLSIAAGRLSFVLGTQGPLTSIDTACSSALVALDGASLYVGPGYTGCLALTLAVSVMLTSLTHTAFATAGMLSTDGRCKTFDVRANGYARGEGVTAIVLSTLATDGLCTIVSMLQSSEVRSDGRSASLTAPSGAAQARMISAALKAADIKVVEQVQTHGTGTPLGDPVEVGALERVLGGTGSVLGSIKSALGHTEPVAGLAGLMPLVNTLAANCSAANGQLRIVNPRLLTPFQQLKARVPTQGSQVSTESLAGGVHSISLAGGVSSFGYSGTIAHAALRRTRSAEDMHSPTSFLS